jgi:hypothetical protein
VRRSSAKNRNRPSAVVRYQLVENPTVVTNAVFVIENVDFELTSLATGVGRDY